MLKSKTFRLPKWMIEHLEHQSRITGQSQTALIEEALREKINLGKQWSKDLESISQDQDYKTENNLMAEEYYE